MFAGFRLKTEQEFSQYEAHGRALFDSNRKHVESKLDGFLLQDGSIDGGDLQENWFPQIHSDVFISHSHKDEKRAISFAGYLDHCFGVKAFVDSCVWGYADKLLREIDDSYCSTGDGYYSYQKRNYSTGHVHMMLATALSMMIDKTECVVFLNTPSSIRSYSVIERTYSPWIYHELAMTRLIRRRKLEHHRRDLLKKSEKSMSLDESLKVSYPVALEHLCSINDGHIDAWLLAQKNRMLPYALDHLYAITETR